jgi:uncharacterized protein involved in response to NO
MHFSIYEAIMLICFGAAWPFSIVRSWRSRTSKGKSIFFLFVVEVGYVAGIMNKVTQNQCHDPVLWLYILNIAMVGTDAVLYFRNRRLDKLAARVNRIDVHIEEDVILR